MYLEKHLMPLSGKKKCVRFRVEPDHVVYAIGDVHGYSDALDTLLRDIKADIGSPKNQTAHDCRNGFSWWLRLSRTWFKRRFKYLSSGAWKPSRRSYKRTFAGNHDYLLYKMLTLEDPMNAVDLAKSLLENGDLNTAASYGVFCKMRPQNPANKMTLKGAGLMVTLQSLTSM